MTFKSGKLKTRIHLPATAGEVTRNSVNDATDANDFVHATIVVPPNNGAVFGSRFVMVSKWECTNSAGAKTITSRINGSSVGSGSLASVSTYGQEQPFDVLDLNTLLAINSFGSPGAGGNGNPALKPVVAGLALAGFSWSVSSKWSGATAGEFIRLLHAKIIQINP